MRSHGTFAWNELATSDVATAKAFYAATLGWTFQEFALPHGPYWVAMSGEQLVGGLGGMDTAAVPGTTTSTWFAFLEVDEIDTRLTKAVAHGATIVAPAEDVPNVGRCAVLRDPTGAIIGWMTSLASKPE